MTMKYGLSQMVATAVAGVALLTAAPFVYAQDAYEQLRTKLAAIDTLQAQFEQQVFDDRGELQEQLSGELTLKRPHFLRWETEFPDESVMVADGRAVWYYNAFVEQLSIFDQAQDLEQNPMLVLLSDDESAWQSFEVSVDDGMWYIRENQASYAQTSLGIRFSDSNAIQTLKIDDGQGQVSVFELSQIRMNEPVNDALFEVEVPAHVDIDDQRSR
ncbi:outer membrane lipoprotein chaperone LolA [Aliidiomarina maris]|uniref:Outer-membrane lipoprotein carrier protein n=1 Tax=Aliidiomarina maris TaxID=531312 RepID=A0A327WUJ3_9GAMM|nr:outer membrane lipoprotein chaperone LolA [Aliidiomarina maris]RAJ96447.1 outer membrane lipoprotein carrier protein [Aliidiomarina maris]RUO23800.1 outer membrane lipoprotein carrier protein LolA [Aliidiomarina maris]